MTAMENVNGRLDRAWIDQSSVEKEGKEDETEKMKKRLDKEGKDCGSDGALPEQLMWERVGCRRPVREADIFSNP